MTRAEETAADRKDSIEGASSIHSKGNLNASLRFFAAGCSCTVQLDFSSEVIKRQKDYRVRNTAGGCGKCQDISVKPCTVMKSAISLDSTTDAHSSCWQR